MSLYSLQSGSRTHCTTQMGLVRRNRRLSPTRGPAVESALKHRALRQGWMLSTLLEFMGAESGRTQRKGAPKGFLRDKCLLITFLPQVSEAQRQTPFVSSSSWPCVLRYPPVFPFFSPPDPLDDTWCQVGLLSVCH